MGFELTTFIFEIINFLVLTWLLHRLVYRPLRDGIAARREAGEQREREAEAKLAEAEQLRAEADARAKQTDELRRKALQDATERASEERARILEQAREDARAERARGERLIEAEREAAAARIREMAIEQSSSVAGRLLLELAPEAVDGALLDRLLVELERRAEELREGERGDAARVEVRSAHPVNDAQRKRLRETLTAALGTSVRLTLEEDDELVAGYVVRVGNRVLDASLAGQLTAFRDRVRELAGDEVRVG